MDRSECLYDLRAEDRTSAARLFATRTWSGRVELGYDRCVLGSRACKLTFVLFAVLASCAPVDELAALDGQTANSASGAPCIEQRSALGQRAETPLGFRVDELRGHVEGARSARLTWAARAQTWLRITVGAVQATYVQSRINPDYDVPYSDRRCADHLRLVAPMELNSEDGKLSEAVGSVVLIAHSLDEVHGTFVIASPDFKGSYRPTLVMQRCWLRTEFRLLFSSEGVSGSLLDVVGAGPCEESGQEQVYAGGHWGTRWLNY
jgi:hypothetical protein